MLEVKNEVEKNVKGEILGVPKISKILVVLRNDVDYDKTVDYVINFASSMVNPSIHLLYIANIEPVLADEKAERKFYEKLRKEGKKIVENAIKRLSDAGVDVKFHGMYFGIAAEKILKTENEINPDLIVLGSRGLSTLRKMVVGSVSDEVSKKTVTPVLIVRSTNHNGRV